MPKSMKGFGKVEVLKHRDFIQQKLDAGYNIKYIYDDIGDNINISYRQFLRVVQRHLIKHEIKEIKNIPIKKEETKNSSIYQKDKKFHHKPTITENDLNELIGD